MAHVGYSAVVAVVNHHAVCAVINADQVEIVTVLGVVFLGVPRPVGAAVVETRFDFEVGRPEFFAAFWSCGMVSLREYSFF